ncbi:TPA: autotransporter outer membrane beta-barrel domain-containing protein, partial [Escherichia coli]
MGGTGSSGDLYYARDYKKYYLLKAKKYSPFYSDLNNQSVWQYVGNNLSTALDAYKKNKIQMSSQPSYIYHGKIEGNLDIVIHALSGNDIITFDGTVNIPDGYMSKEKGSLIFQGHPVLHAGKQPTATQTDWEDRQFTLDHLKLNNANFSLSRNATMTGDIIATNKSTITIGSDKVFTDKNDSTGETPVTVEGKSINTGSTSYTGNMKLSDSVLSIADIFNGGIFADNSNISVLSNKTIFDMPTSLINTPLNILKNAHLSVQDGFFTDSDITISDGKLTMSGKETKKNTYLPSVMLSYGKINLTSDNAVFEAKDYVSVTADINSDKNASLLFGHSDDASDAIISPAASQRLATGLLSGFNTAYNGAINAAQSSGVMHDTWWQVTGNSKIKSMDTTGSFIQFTGDKNKFHSLQIDELTTNNSAFVMRTNSQQADQLIVKNRLEGKNNLLLVDFIVKDAQNKKLDIPLVTAPAGTSDEVFTTSTKAIGFSDVTPVIENKTDDNEKIWTLTGYQIETSPHATSTAQSFMSSGYKSFLFEVNNLNKRMGDLRDINGEAGAWARIMSGAGSAGGGYSDNYTHVQIGADKKHELDGLDLFTGMTMTYTDSNAGNNDFSGKTKSVGAGLYASAMFDAGAYIDLIGKYVHHDNEYTASFAGLGTKNYSSHSWYAGAEVGYRYHVTDDAWIEPQAELVYGAVSGKQFTWKDQGMSLSMKDKDFNPLIGRTGLDVGKSFTGKDWKVIARAGLGYQFDLFANGETVLRDASGEKRIKGEKDGRMLMNVGLNAEIRDNFRFGLEFEKSAFGKYNVD